VDEVRETVSGVERRLTAVEQKAGGSQQGETERSRTELHRLAEPAGYLAAGALGGYLVLLIGSFVIAPGLVASVVIAGIVAVLAVVFGRGNLRPRVALAGSDGGY
jgi:hypothetical protein